MTGRELYLRCVKARIVSWLNSSQCGAMIHTLDGTPIVLAVYNNGRYVDPETMVPETPNSPADLWGPDGPIYRSPPPEAPPEGSPDADGLN